MNRLVPILEEIRDNQRKQIAISEEALQLTKDSIRRAEKIQGSAEAMQATCKRLLYLIVIPILLLLIGFLIWDMYTRF